MCPKRDDVSADFFFEKKMMRRVIKVPLSQDLVDVSLSLML